jgi:hypothetical protein
MEKLKLNRPLNAPSTTFDFISLSRRFDLLLKGTFLTLLKIKKMTS